MTIDGYFLLAVSLAGILGDNRGYMGLLSAAPVLSVVEEQRVQEIRVGLSRLPGQNSTRLLPLPSMLSQFLRSVQVALRLGP